MAASIRPETALASEASSVAKAAVTKAAAKPSPAKTMADPAPASPSLAARLAAFRPALRPPRLVLVGFAAASMVFLFVAFGPTSTTAPLSAALTGPIPKRQLVVETAVTVPLPSLSTLKDPIADMIAHVEERQLPPTAADDARPILAGAEIVEGLAQFTAAADVVGLQRLLRPGESYTIFVPNDAAFSKLPPGVVDGLLDPSGHERLLTMLSHHIVPERLTFEDFAGSSRDYTSLAGQPLTIDATEVIRIDEAGMIETDLPLENGVLHVIDQVLAAPSY